MQTVLEATKIDRIYGKKDAKFQALYGVNLDIKKGEKIAIVGKSGSGKSTLMHILACLDQATNGTLEVNGRNVSGLSEKEVDQLRSQEFGFVFQQFFVNPNDSVVDNVALPLKIAGVSKKKRREQALKALEDVDLADKANSKTRDLSGGQKQRVCIARAIVNSPSVIFADEPTGNLDSATGEKIIQLLFDLNKKQQITLVIVTHDEDLARRCDRQVTLVDGRIEKAKVVKK